MHHLGINIVQGAASEINELIIHYVKRHINPREKKGKNNQHFFYLFPKIFNQGIENLLSTFIPKIFMLYGHMDDQNKAIDSESSNITAENKV
jgi:hypothetical protein